MIAYSNCKINLGLSVLRRRDDGFSDIETVFYPLRGIKDVIEIIPAPKFDFTSSGIAVDCPAEQNLCVKAFRLMQARFSVSDKLKIHLHKTIPFGAGLGAGSANAVAVVKMVDTIYNIGITRAQFLELAAELGSDTSFFVDNTPAVATSRGEILTPCSVDLSGKYIMIVKPNVGVSTALAYRSVAPATPATRPSAAVMLPIEKWRANLKNDFEKPIFEELPILAQIKADLYAAGAIYASMSGSGSTIYGIFDTKPTIKFDAFCYIELV